MNASIEVKTANEHSPGHNQKSKKVLEAHRVIKEDVFFSY
jgi:hypothetical protein